MRVWSHQFNSVARILISWILAGGTKAEKIRRIRVSQERQLRDRRQTSGHPEHESYNKTPVRALPSCSPLCWWCCSAGMAHSLAEYQKHTKIRFASRGVSGSLKVFCPKGWGGGNCSPCPLYSYATGPSIWQMLIYEFFKAAVNISVFGKWVNLMFDL